MNVEQNRLSERVIGAAIEVHRQLGPGLLESAYELALMCELSSRGLNAESQVIVPLTYKSRVLAEEAYRIDILVEDKLVLELKSVAKLQPVHAKQLLTYLRLADKRLGLLVNFNEPRLVDGVRRLAN